LAHSSKQAVQEKRAYVVVNNHVGCVLMMVQGLVDQLLGGNDPITHRSKVQILPSRPFLAKPYCCFDHPFWPSLPVQLSSRAQQNLQNDIQCLSACWV